MKNLICSLVILASALISKAQTTYPVVTPWGNPIGLQNIPNYGALRGGLIPYAFTDTTAANTALTYLKNYNGALIYTTSDSALWFRAGMARWTQILPSGGGSGSNAWLTRGNDLSGQSLPNRLGTKNGDELNIITTDLVRLIIPAGGIVRSSSAQNKYLMIDTVGKELYYGDAGGGGSGTVTSVGLTVPSPASPAFSVSGSPVTTSGTLAISALGTTNQYVRGDGSLDTYGTATSMVINGLASATNNGSVDLGAFRQIWLPSGVGNVLGSLSITSVSGTLVNDHRNIQVGSTGSFAASGITTYGIFTSMGGTGTSKTNIGNYSEALNGTNNYAFRGQASGGTNNYSFYSVVGDIGQAGSSSGVITMKTQAAAGTFNWNWPTTAGTSGYFLTSGGGGGTAMTWTNPSTLTPSLTSTYIGYGSAGNALTGDANLTYTAASSAVVLDSGYLSFTGNKDFGSSVTGSIFKNSSYGLTFRAVPGALYDMLFFTQGGSTLFANPTGTTQMGTVSDWGFGLLGSTISAKVHIAAGSTSAGTAPLKFNSGSLMTASEVGAVEFLTDKFYGTITTGAARKEFTLNDAALTSGRVPYVTTNGRLTDVSTFTFGSGLLSVPQIKGSGSTPSIAGGAGAGSTPTVSIAGTDLAGEITVTTDTDPATGAVFCTVTFATAFGTAPYVVITPSSTWAAKMAGDNSVLYVESTTTTFTLNTNDAGVPASSREFKFHYHVIQ